MINHSYSRSDTYTICRFISTRFLKHRNVDRYFNLLRVHIESLGIKLVSTHVCEFLYNTNTNSI